MLLKHCWYKCVLIKQFKMVARRKPYWWYNGFINRYRNCTCKLSRGLLSHCEILAKILVLIFKGVTTEDKLQHKFQSYSMLSYATDEIVKTNLFVLFLSGHFFSKTFWNVKYTPLPALPCNSFFPKQQLLLALDQGLFYFIYVYNIIFI